MPSVDNSIVGDMRGLCIPSTSGCCVFCLLLGRFKSLVLAADEMFFFRCVPLLVAFEIQIYVFTMGEYIVLFVVATLLLVVRLWGEKSAVRDMCLNNLVYHFSLFINELLCVVISYSHYNDKSLKYLFPRTF